MEENKPFPIEPLMDRVFVKKDDMSIDKKSGLHLPDTVKGRAQTGTVVAVGPGYLDVQTGKFYPISLKVGDRIFIDAFAGTIFKHENENYFIFNEREILGKFI